MRIALSVLCLLLAGCMRALPTGVTELVYATPYSPSHPFSRADADWMDFVARRSGGRLRIRPSWAGALLSSEHSMIELRHGVTDIGLIAPIYIKGGVHLIRIQSGFYSGVGRVEQQVALYRCLAAASPQFDAELHGLKVLAVQGGSLPGIVTRERAVHRLADLRGMRLRAPTELLGVLEDLGADPVNMPMGEVYSALARGVIDGVIAPADTLKALHFADVARYFTTLAVPRGAYPARAMNLRRWQALSPQQRQILEEGIAVWEAALARQTRRALEEGFEVARTSEVAVIPIDPAEQRKFDLLYLHDAERSAHSLERYDIDGLSVFATARASIAADGSIACKGGS
ncbi:MAG: TRAP transporter substrate-binding protein DctP [Gammaproteobacteria bacterium]|nr:TRAP transporter substrate-binding protein DctP [Gammaproteobacteria bacterium]